MKKFIFKNLKVCFLFTIFFVSILFLKLNFNLRLKEEGTLGSFKSEGNRREPLLCAPLLFARRTGKQNCWAQFQLSDSRQLCIPKNLWIHWLVDLTETSVCADSTQVWKVFSPVENSNNKDDSVQTKDKPNKHSIFSIRANQILAFPPRPSKVFHSARSFWIYLLKHIERQREHFSELIRPIDRYGILRKLLFNEGCSNSPLPIFRRIGFVHLISTSGIHLYAVTQIWSRLMEIAVVFLRLPIHLGLWINRLFSFGICLTIWTFGGARLGMLRPWGILMMREVAVLSGFKWRKASPLLIALSLDLVFTFLFEWMGYKNGPISGRWIYALAVGGGLFWSQSLSSLHFSLAVGSWILVALWEAWETGILTLATPLISFITLPMICLIAYPLIIFSLFFDRIGFADLTQSSLAFLSDFISWIVLYFSKFAFLTGNLWIIPQWAIFFALALSSAYVTIRPSLKQEWKGAIILIIFCIGLRCILNPRIGRFSSRVPSSTPGIAENVEQLDVDQGDAALVKDAETNSYGLVDFGPIEKISDDQWLTLLAKRQIHKISWSALTHLDSDHAGGLQRLSKLISIECVGTSLGELLDPRRKNVLAQLRSSGITLQPWSKKCVPYPVLEPPIVHSKSHNQNMGAIWIPLKSGGFYLSAGDASAKDELRIGEWATRLSSSTQVDQPQLKERNFPEKGPLPPLPLNNLSPRILKVSHHGSRFSSSDSYLKLIKPTEAWISSGVGNRYGHPHFTTLQKLKNLGIRIRRTDREGNLSSPQTRQKVFF